MKNKNLAKYYILLLVLTLVIILLIILFTKLNYTKPSELKGFPSISLWKPFGDLDIRLNLSGNDSAIEKNRQTENPSNTELIKATAQRYWLSFIVLFLIVVLLIAWVMIVFKIYNG